MLALQALVAVSLLPTFATAECSESAIPVLSADNVTFNCAQVWLGPGANNDIQACNPCSCKLKVNCL